MNYEGAAHLQCGKWRQAVESPQPQRSHELKSRNGGDYGTPKGICKETAPGVFERGWTKAHVTLDCNTWTGTVAAVPTRT